MNLMLRYNSVARIPFECSNYQKKSIFLHLQPYKQFGEKHKGLKKSFITEQKNFICTSFYFLKDKSDNKPLSSDNEVLSKNSTKSKVEKSDENVIDLKTNVKIVKANQTLNSKDEFNLPKEIQEIPLRQKDPLFNIQMVNSQELKQNKEDPFASEIKKESLSSSKINSKNFDSHVLETMILSKHHKEGQPMLIGEHPVRGPKIIKQCDSQFREHSEGQNKVQEKPTLSQPKNIESEDKKVDEVKRQIKKTDLAKLNKDFELKSLQQIIDHESSRRVKEERGEKETTQNIIIETAKSILKKTASSLKSEDSRNVTALNLGGPKGDVNLNSGRRRQTVDLNKCSTERNFITPVRAMTDFLLKPSDLEGLRKTKRRSPYENDPPITVYWRKDVETKALDVWGSKENLLKEILKRDIERRRYQQNIFTVKRRLRDYRREQGRETEVKSEQNGLFGPSGKVVLTAVVINGSNFLLKLVAWLYTGSHSMFSETIHSLADTINQLILAYGIHKSVQRADSDHPYGYTNMRYVASLISGVGIFCVGSGLSLYHGVIGLADPTDMPSFYWAYLILFASLASEGATLLVAFNSIRAGAKKSEMSLSEYVFRGQDPSVNVVLLEDLAAVIGVAFAGSCMGLSSFYQSHIPDAIGSFLVGGLLAGVASFIIYTNVAALVGRSIPQERLDKINSELESDVMIRAIHDVKGIDIGNSLVRYKAELDFDGGELTRSYLDKQDLNQMLEEVKDMKTIDDLEEFMLKHGENIVDMMGGEIDRIELKLRKKHPEIRHCDLEIL